MRSINVCVLFLWALFAPLTVADCACPKKVLVDVWSLFEHNTYFVPPESSRTRSGVSNAPTIGELVVNEEGFPCSFRILNAASSDRISVITAAVQKWKFRPASIVGSASNGVCCLRSKVFFYEKEQGGRNIWLIPGLTDRPK